MQFNFFHVMVLMTSTIFVTTKAYRLRGRDTGVTRNPGLELSKFLNKWIESTDLSSHNDGFPQMTYTFHMIPYEGSTDVIAQEEESSQADDYYDLGHLSFLDQERLKSVGSIEELAEITGLPLLLEQNTNATDEMATFTSDLPSLSSSFSRLPESSPGVTLKNAELRRRHHGNKQKDLNIARRALCEPEKVSVPLKADVGFLVIPSCVRIKKCGGCCNPGLICVPTRTKQLKVNVARISLHNRPILLKDQVWENVTEDEECGCKCIVHEEDCLPTQDYNSASCSCICKENLGTVKRDCINRGHFWDTNRCMCQCPLQGPRSSSDCGSGQTFNSLTCSCDNE